MKFHYFLIAGILAILLFSCNKDESMIFETETNLQIDVLMATEIKSGTATAETDYSFSGDGTFTGVKIINVDNRLYQIHKVKPHSSPQLSIPEIEQGGVFNSLIFEWGYKGPADADYTMQEPIDLLLFENQLSEGIFSVKLDDALVGLINNLDSYPENSIMVILTGTSNFNFSSTANLDIPVIVETETMNARFEVF